METPYYVTDCPGHGRGVFTNRSYQPGEYVMTFTGHKTHIDQISDFTHYLQIAPDVFISPSGNADDFVNHSCNPNCALYFEDNALVLRTITTIGQGQELFFDYGTVMFSEPTTFQCTCGSPSCRRIIGNYYSLPEEVKTKFRLRNMVPLLCRYSLEEIQASRRR